MVKFFNIDDRRVSPVGASFYVTTQPMFKVISIILLLFCYGCRTTSAVPSPKFILNDVHSKLNIVQVDKIERPKSVQNVVEIIQEAKKSNKAISISGAKHAMGGQQFGKDTTHISMTEMNEVISFDPVKGIVRVEAGITWPQLIEDLSQRQKDSSAPWVIVQKQTGADQLTLGGALSANIHGRGVKYKPIIQDVESFTLVNADGKVLNVSRTENPELFSLVIGGYGLFGVIATVDLRLTPRQKLQRSVEVVNIEDLEVKTKQRIADGALYGDFQYNTNSQSEDFMKEGVFSTYKPVSHDTPIPFEQEKLTPEQWYKLLHLAHVDKSQAFKMYSQHYLKTNGQIYWSDTHQAGFYADKYVEYLEKVEPNYPKGSLMITEVYVPRKQLNAFIDQVIEDVHQNQINVIYGTMRLIQRDDESYLAWAKQDYACIIFNVRVEHSDQGIAKAQKDFQLLIERALELGGSYYLTYHRWARKDQVLKAYPQFVEFMKFKKKYDPQERFQSEWYRHYKSMFSEELK